MRILLIEPDVVQASTYRTAFERAGHAVEVSNSAQSAVRMADEHVPDAVVLELQLAGHNGVEFLYEFRSYREWLHIPVVIHTFVPPSELSRAATLERELGVQCVLHKPKTSLGQLVAAVETVQPVANRHE